MSIGKFTYDEDVFSNEEQILGVIMDRKLIFHQHIKNICPKSGQKLSALLRLFIPLRQKSVFSQNAGKCGKNTE